MASKRRKRVNKGTWSHSSHDILGGKGVIFKVKQSGDVWQFRMWVGEERKYVRKSLKTKDLPTALERGEKQALEILGNVKAGKKIFGLTLGELKDLYLDWRATHVGTEDGQITQGRFVTIKSQMKNLLRFMDEDMKLEEISEMSSFYDYRTARLSQGAKLVTIRNEQATINQMFRFGFRKKICPFERVDFQPISIGQDEVGKRGKLSTKEYKQLVKYMRKYVSKKECPDELQRRERLMVRDAILIATNTLMRVGEWQQLTWRDVKGIRKRTDDVGKEAYLVTFEVRKPTSKRRSTRTVITRGGEYFRRLKKF